VVDDLTTDDRVVVPAGLDYITALRAPEIKALVEVGAIQLGFFDETDLFEIAHPDYSGERLVCAKNALFSAEWARKRESLLCSTEAALEKIAEAVRRERRPLRGKDKIALRVGSVLVFSQTRRDRCRGRARRDLCVAHEPSLGNSRDRRRCLLLQSSRRCRARVSCLQH